MGLFIVDFETRAQAQQWFENEAYYRGGVYKEFKITPYLDAMSFC